RTTIISYGGTNIIIACGGGAQNVTGGDGYRNVKGLAGQCTRKGVKYAAFLRLPMFVLFIWIEHSSHRTGNHGIVQGTPQRGQVIVHKSTNRLVAEPPMNFDEVYGTFEENVLEKLGYDEEQCQTVKNSVKSYSDKIKWNVANEQSAEESEKGSGGSDNASDKRNRGKGNYKCAGIWGSLIDSVVNYKLTSFTILILALGYFQSRYLLEVMSIVILLNVFWELESLNEKLKILNKMRSETPKAKKKSGFKKLVLENASKDSRNILVQFGLPCSTVRICKMAEVTFSEWNTNTYLESGKRTRTSFKKENKNISNTGRIIRDRIHTFTLLKVLIFLLLIWIVQYSGRDTIHEIRNNGGISEFLGGYRLLAESEVSFDGIFHLYKENFLNKMGYTDEDAERIRTTVKSHLDQAKSIDIDRRRKEKSEVCEDIIKQGTDNSVSKFSNNFRVLSSPYFLAVCSFILFYNGYYRFFLALMGILIFKFVNFFWDLKYICAGMTKNV
ncbi:Pv-fam-h protein, partial [Plasmodium coatneyi]